MRFQEIVRYCKDFQELKRNNKECGSVKKIINFLIFIVDVRQWMCIMLFMLIEKIRKHIQNCGKSLNQLGRETGIDKAALSRIVNGGSCKVETAEILLKYFGYELVQKKQKKIKRKRKQ
jgi:hypothetical protein